MQGFLYRFSSLSALGFSCSSCRYLEWEGEKNLNCAFKMEMGLQNVAL